MIRGTTTRIGYGLACGIICLGCAVVSPSQEADFDRGLSLFKQRQWSEASARFEAAEKLQPGKTDAPLYRGKCLINLSLFDEAADTLQSYLAVHPQSEDASYLLAYVYFREDKPKRSLEQYSEAGKLKTPTADDLKIVSLDYVLLNDYPDAAHYLEVALRMEPENVEVRYHLGRVRYQQNQFDQAIAAFQEVLKRDPSHVKAEDNLGLSLEAENKTDLAMAAYQKAILLDASATRHNEQPYLNLGVLLAKMNRAGDALPLLAKAVQMDPKSEKIRYQLGKTYFDLNRIAESQQEAQEAVKLNPGDVPPHYLLARIYQRQGKRELAQEQFKLTESLVEKSKAASGGSGMASQADRN
jgi:tetratricopeptide (TPR) repeat protein